MQKRPNIIFMVADDLGFADLGCSGGRDAQLGLVCPVLPCVSSQRNLPANYATALETVLAANWV